jgi:hypothetical protein
VPRAIHCNEVLAVIGSGATSEFGFASTGRDSGGPIVDLVEDVTSTRPITRFTVVETVVKLTVLAWLRFLLLLLCHTGMLVVLVIRPLKVSRLASGLIKNVSVLILGIQYVSLHALNLKKAESKGCHLGVYLISHTTTYIDKKLKYSIDFIR